MAVKTKPGKKTFTLARRSGPPEPPKDQEAAEAKPSASPEAPKRREDRRFIQDGSGEAINGGITEIVKITRLTPENAEFCLDRGGFLNMSLDGEDKGRVGAHRMTPVTDPFKHLSVRDMELKEIGIVFDLAAFPPEQRALVEKDLSLRYFMPVVKEIKSLKEEYGYTFVNLITDAGPREFTMRDLSNSLHFLTPTKCMMLDTDGNRYLIEDVRAMGEKAMRVIGVWA